MRRKYAATGPEAEFELGSRGRVLRNLLGITRVRDMNEAESQALELAQDAALDQYGPSHRFTAKDIRACIGSGSARFILGRATIEVSISARVVFSSRMHCELQA